MATSTTAGIFVTGTDTDVGKTYVGCCIARALVAAGYRVGVYKPAASGCSWRDGQLVADDAERLWHAAGRPGELEHVCPQRFAAPLAPSVAARQEGRRVDERLLRSGLGVWLDNSDIVLVEGVGGLMSPVSDEDYVADLAFEFGFPMLVVAANVLGVINHTLQTLITAATFREGIDVAGIVLNDLGHDASADPSMLSNHQQLAAHCVPPIVATLSHRSSEFAPPVDWFSLAGKWLHQ
jgi:dethiobiotin synthetase